MLRKKPWTIGEADKAISDTIEGNDMIFLTLRFWFVHWQIANPAEEEIRGNCCNMSLTLQKEFL